MRALRLSVLPDDFAICRLDPAEPLPAWPKGSLVSVSRTPNELSIVCGADAVPTSIRCAARWRAFAVEGPLDFSEVGIIASIAHPLAAAGISLFAISTFDTDYVLVREADLARAREILIAAGHSILGRGRE